MFGAGTDEQTTVQHHITTFKEHKHARTDAKPAVADFRVD
jgi:hypothetical protein